MMDKFKAKASEYLSTITELTRDLTNIVIEPENKITELGIESLKNYHEAINEWQKKTQT